MGRRSAFSPFFGWVAYAGPALLGLFVLTLSTAAFLYRYRNDLLILCAQQRSAEGIHFFSRLGASASGATALFPEPALIEYLLVLQSPLEPVSGTTEAVTDLLEAGASVQERNSGGWTPLMLAASAGEEGIVRLLVKRGADVNARGIGSESTEGITALMTAAMYGHVPIVRFLLDSGADVHLRSRSGFTALLLASSRGHENCVKTLLEKGAAVSPSVVHVAEQNGHSHIVRLLQAAAPARRSTLTRRPARLPEE
jgi:hypothetical protein